MNISFCSVVLSLIQGIALNTDVPPCSQGWGVTVLRYTPYTCGSSAHSLAAAKLVDLSSDNDEDVKPLVKKGHGGGGGDSSSGRYGGDIGY
jgi:hypothetical protein